MKTVAFVENGLGMRGTQGTMWGYAHYNETILGNKSIIIMRYPPNVRSEDITDASIQFFVDRFETYCIPDGDPASADYGKPLETFLIERKVDAVYFVISGRIEPVPIPKNIPSIAHLVFAPDFRRATLQVAISEKVAAGTCEVLPNMICIDRGTGDHDHLREELGIPANAKVFGRYGGWCQFDIPFVQQTVIAYASEHPEVYFLFMHTRPFGASLPMRNIIFLPGSRDLQRKGRFIRTCDAMIHARSDGETYGMSVGEFAVMGKPIITTDLSTTGDLVHIEYLRQRNDAKKEGVFIYRSPEDLYRIFDTFEKGTRITGTRYEEHIPEKAIQIFKQYLNQIINS